MVDSRPQAPRRRRFAGRTRPTLALGGLAAAASFTLAGCGGTPEFDNAQFTSVSECVKAGFPDDLCQTSYGAALQEHQQGAPQFSNLRSCEQEWGQEQCVPASGTSASSGSNIFVPMLAGFVLSRALQRNYYDRGPGFAYYGGYGGSPIYRDRGGSTVTVDRSGGRAIKTPVNVNTTTVARSGFGGMGKSRSFGG
ncbi:DUF1190 domain-containing protein [Novosphingobium sp. RD2P27]|uniref:DUF1190 domain-containing protein n=1 Tax=Novosphingobium kalidii TaxID=3230299 RepID=A0ABV2D4P3_9SPHN